MTHPRLFAESNPDKPAIIMSDSRQTMTYGELERQANRGAHLFRKHGLKKGDTVALWLPNITEYFVAYWAAQRAGLYVTPIPTALTAEEAAYILNDSGAKLLLAHSEVKGFAKLLASHLPTAIDSIYVVDHGAPDLNLWEAYLRDCPDTPIGDESAGFHLVYSSGTTGRPKGIRLPLDDGPVTAPHSLAERIAAFGIDETTVYLSPAPLYHTAPLAYTTSCHRLGATVVVMPRFEPQAALAAIEAHAVTHTQMVPTMFVRMLRLPDEVRLNYDLSSLKVVIHAAAPCPVEIKRQMLEWFGPILYEFYGGSEGNGSTSITPQEWLKKPGSVGKASWGKIHICDDDGNICPSGTPGIVYFEGGWDFEYMNDPEKTRSARHPLHPSWSTLGDIGYLDDDDYLFLTDRKSFMIISGGVNIYPQEIENLLISHPKVMDAAVIGVPNSEMGEEVKAVVQPVNWHDATDQFAHDLIAHCRAHLSSVKCPKTIDFEKALPRLDNGKLYKQGIRSKYWPENNARLIS